jgi:hypothetical protein
MMDPNFFQADVNQAWLTITYLDKGSSQLYLHSFNSDDKAGANQVILATGDTGEWITTTLPMDGAHFNQEGWDYDYWITVTGSSFFIADMTISLTKPVDYQALHDIIEKVAK